MNSNGSPGSIFNLKKPWSENSNIIWLASTVKLQRNIEKFKFPGKLDLDRKKQIIALTGKELMSSSSLKDALLLKPEEMSSLEREFLVEHFLSCPSLHQASVGEAFLVDEKGEVLVILNISDHLCFMIVDVRQDLDGAWNQLVKIETNLGKDINYSFSQKFGFMTADPAKCGTALTLASFLQLSGLIHTGKLQSYLEDYADENFEVTGIQGNPNEHVGDIVVIKNNYTLGVTEENILSSMRTLVSKLINAEKAERVSITHSKNAEIMDKVSRAYAILLYSYQADAIESLDAISLLKFGVDVGWIEGVTVEELNRLFFSCRRGHLQGQFQEKISPADLPHRRAEYIHQSLKEAKLLL